ncbi:MAG: hypothetical protein KDA25_00955 [Phycisphaerales bacterium]|nr:hypothetical protein [Phycisphaerales bacterium]
MMMTTTMMTTTHRSTRLRRVLLAAGAAIAIAGAAHGAAHTSQPFRGVKANVGTVTHSYDGGRHVLTLSPDFKVPDTPAPHWQIVDRAGNTYLLQRLVVKDDKLNRAVTVPSYITSIASVQIWCAWAETLLGEARFDTVIDLGGKDDAGGTRVSSAFKGAKANRGFVRHDHQDGRCVLTLSDDFVVPDTPAPHWQVVDRRGNVYLLQRLAVKGDHLNRSITVPAYVSDIDRVQIWCSWAEVLLGEARFDPPVP